MLLVLDTGICFIFYMMTNTSHFWSETLYNKRHPWKELQEFGTYDTSQYTWQNTKGGIKKLTYYEFIFTCYTTPLTWIVHQLPRREDRCTPRAALTGLPCSYTSNRTRPFCSLLPPGWCILCSLTLELEKHKNLASFFFSRNANFTLSQLSCGGNVPQGNWMQPYHWIHKPIKAAHWLTGMHKATSITTRIKSGLGWVGFFLSTLPKFQVFLSCIRMKLKPFNFQVYMHKKTLGYCWKLDKTLHCFLARTPSWNTEDQAECCI